MIHSALMLVRDPLDKERICLAARRNTDDDMGLLGGSVEPGEKPRTAAIREAREEALIHVTECSLVLVKDGVATYEAHRWTKEEGVGDCFTRWGTWDEACSGSFGAYNAEVRGLLQRQDVNWSPIFVDLHHELGLLSSTGVANRIAELSTKLSGVYVMAVGGFPITMDKGVLRWTGSVVTVERIRDEIRNGLGLSGMLTYANATKLPLRNIGDVCLKLKHEWAYRWMGVTLLFVGYDLAAELAFSRADGFQMSWPVVKEPTGRVFAVSGSLASWGWYLSHANDSSFDSSTRAAMHAAADVTTLLLPRAP
jgi:8-oxo-dGTP pyrophosphatase MutT (NUDIX family)